MIKNELLPEQISLTPQEFQFNCKKLQAYNANYQSKQMMENHLHGEVLQTHTIVAPITGSDENKLVATQVIPAGSILGMYFGKVYPTNQTGLSPRSLDVAKYEYFFNQKQEKIATYLIVGELDNALTRAATMNHAYSADINNILYNFINPDVAEHVATRNVLPHYFDITLTQNGEVQHVSTTAFVALRNIYPGEALLLSYDDPFAPSPFPHYWESRHITPLLFTKSGDFLPQHLYSFNKISKPSVTTTIHKTPHSTTFNLRIGRLIFVLISIIAIAIIANLHASTNTTSITTHTSRPH